MIISRVGFCIWKWMLYISSPVKFSASEDAVRSYLNRKLLTRPQFALESWHDFWGWLVRKLLAGGRGTWPEVQPRMWSMSAGSKRWQGYQQCTWRTKPCGPHPAKICPSTANICAKGDTSWLKTRNFLKIVLTPSAIHTVFSIGYALFLIKMKS